MQRLTKQDNLQILNNGLKILKAINKYQRNLGKDFFIGLILKISSYNENFKTNLFRLIDVLPSLKNEKAVAIHINQYLYPPARKINRIFALAFKIPLLYRPFAKISNWILRFSVKQISSFFIAATRPEELAPIINKIHPVSYTHLTLPTTPYV